MPLRPHSLILFALAALPGRAGADDAVPATVTVTGKREAVVRKLDRTVHDVASMPRAANGTAQDVLQSIPEVAVTADGEIAVKGNSQVTVLVDGKPSVMMAGEERAVALQTMSGADIASVEVITNPSAAQQANGGAIVNIVLKRNRKRGARAQLRGSVSDRSLWNVAASGELAGPSVSTRASLAFRHDGTLKTRQSATSWDASPGGRTLQSSRVFVRRKVASASIGVDAALSEIDTLSLSARHHARRSHPTLDTLNDVRAGAAETIYRRISVGPNEQTDDSASLAYSRRGDGTALKATLQRSATSGLVDKSYRDVFVQPARATAYSRGATSSRRRLDQATLDWTQTARHGQWGMGLDIQDEVNDLHNYQADVDPLTGAQAPRLDTTNGYAVLTTLSAAYLTRQLAHGKWEALLGGRIERTALRVHPVQGAVRTTHWQAFNPSLHLKYAAGDQSDLTLSYRRSRQRPDPGDLNPFTTYVDAQNLSRGNPGLAPQRVSSWEIGANTQGGSVGAFYRASRDTVVDARSMDSHGVLVTSKQNGGRARSAGVTGSFDWTLDAQLRAGVDGGAYRVMLDTPENARRDALAGYLNLRAAYKRGRDDVSIDAHVQSAGITPLGRYGSTSSVNLTWKRELTGTLSLTLNAGDIFDGSRRSYRLDSRTLRQEGFDHFVARRVYVGLVKAIE